ncbi:cysteine hydrolase family protein [Vibrio sp. VB16]|uniref:cysteine hydrolase family protein n=1 Tax=Vibrio sp. VB16 TaxID=2785746 RepID=UPI00189CAA63|nr:cysteine hydrolase family protein [Vibrio sp. VB16]UGA53921.1 cysteine hydrolase [Vibrio sp. VB16]
MNQKALIVIDLQYDYFPEGKFPLWNTKQTLMNVKSSINKANSLSIPVIHVQHIADPARGISPFFNEGTAGAEIHKEVVNVAPNGDVVIKHCADAFFRTNLEETLNKYGVDELLICGMMTQNCVTHTAISKSAEKYRVSILSDACTTTDEMIHNIALHAISNRVELLSFEQAF